jgi:hypothetical protein
MFRMKIDSPKATDAVSRIIGATNSFLIVRFFLSPLPRGSIAKLRSFRRTRYSQWQGHVAEKRRKSLIVKDF